MQDKYSLIITSNSAQGNRKLMFSKVSKEEGKDQELKQTSTPPDYYFLW